MNLNDLGLNLNELLERNRDAEKGYREAADKVNSGELETFFKTYSNQRTHFAEDIKGYLVENHREIYEGSSLKGDVHRLWIDFKAMLAGDDNEENVLDECLRGENKALEDYNSILSDYEIPHNLEATLTSHKQGIEEAIISIKELLKIYRENKN